LIGVIPKASQGQAVEELFELFKTPWELYDARRAYDVIIATADEIPELSTRLLIVYGPARKHIDARCGIIAGELKRNAILSYEDTSLQIYGDLATFGSAGERTLCTSERKAAGLRLGDSDSVIIRLGYDLFDEVEFLLSTGQPVDQAHVPTLEIHIQVLRECILNSGIPLVEIPPAPVGHSFAACLTHDIDFVGIRRHMFDHTMWGFVYRATYGALQNVMRGRLSLRQLLRSWLAVASLPFVYVGWAADFWEPFEWFLRVEEGLAATYFLIPFKRRPGERAPGGHPSRRATAYDISDIPSSAAALAKAGCEVGVHGIDSWHSPDKGCEELARVQCVTQQPEVGVRMHWLLRDSTTPCVLEDAGYAYDSTFGYNETTGYRSGTTQVFRPLGAQTLLELPLHVQDGALFFAQRLDLSQTQADQRCQALIDNAKKFGGVLTLLWHDRSHAPERFWGDFYISFIQKLKSLGVWFGTASQVTGWFRKRRQVYFECGQTLDGEHVRLCYDGVPIQPPLRVRLHEPASWRGNGSRTDQARDQFKDVIWNAKSGDQLEFQLATLSSAVPS